MFVCEHTALDQLVMGLMEPCQCGQVKWVTSSRKQVKKKREFFIIGRKKWLSFLSNYCN